MPFTNTTISCLCLRRAECPLSPVPLHGLQGTRPGQRRCFLSSDVQQSHAIFNSTRRASRQGPTPNQGHATPLIPGALMNVRYTYNFNMVMPEHVTCTAFMLAVDTRSFSSNAHRQLTLGSCRLSFPLSFPRVRRQNCGLRPHPCRVQLLLMTPLHPSLPTALSMCGRMTRSHGPFLVCHGVLLL